MTRGEVSVPAVRFPCNSDRRLHDLRSDTKDYLRHPGAPPTRPPGVTISPQRAPVGEQEESFSDHSKKDKYTIGPMALPFESKTLMCRKVFV